MTSYSSKQLRATLVLPQANFPGTSDNTLTLTGYRMSATVNCAARYQNTLDIAIYGMKQEDMNAVTILWSAATPQEVATDALITLEASPDGSAWTQVFNGTFVEASPDYQQVPYACLRAYAVTGNAAQISAAPPTSYKGATSIAEIATYLAGRMGFALENNGVSGNLANPYFPGSYMDQFRELCEHANVDYYFDGNATLAICPANQPRQNKAVPVLSPTSGLINRPSVQRFGIHIDALFTPGLTLGGKVQVTGSDVPGANGTWMPMRTTHQLESLMPDGAWFTAMDCTRVPA